MGCVNSIEDPAADAKSKKIDENIRDNKAALARQVKLLLLGAGESGKSTFLKQLKLIHESQYTEDERYEFKEIIFSNLVTGLQSIIIGLKRFNVEFEPEFFEKIQEFERQSDTANGVHMSPDLNELMKSIWSHETIKNGFSQRSKYKIHVGTGVELYLNEIDRITHEDYIPTEQDIILSRVKTTGVVERSFTYKKMDFRIFDVGGQRSERKKWIHCFEDVTCLIFCVATSAFDEVLIEDETVNRMKESLILFESVCNNQYFEETSIILFMNKMDLFKEKVPTSAITSTFPDYTGAPHDWEESINYIIKQFKDLNQHPEKKQIYVKLTCATDRDNVKFMFEAVTDVIIAEHLKRHELL